MQDVRKPLMNHHFLDYYRCPDSLAQIGVKGSLSEDSGYFRWGEDTVCYGRTGLGSRVQDSRGIVYDAECDAEIRDAVACLPFDPEEVIENLQRERYSAHFREPGSLSRTILRKTYYLLRPYLSVPVRKHLQRIHLRNWDQIPFPEWPVDFTVDRIHAKRLALAMRAQGVERTPFIWFWPDGLRHCVIITHDVEDEWGRDFCGRLMDMNDSFGFRSSFQIVPEVRYEVTDEFLKSISGRGFEVNVHDLNHDGRLYAQRDEFLRRAQRINEYGRRFGASGFRSGILYRNADWYEAFDFSYDMSIPNVAHLDPQHGGCCTVMPFFVGKIVELPLTCTQDYTLFQVLGHYSTDLWKQQINRIRTHSGLVSILVHPDYIMEPRPQDIYKQLLEYLAGLRDDDHTWTPLPRDVAQWWRQRSQMRLIGEGEEWQIEGPGKERACVAWAHLEGDHVSFRLEGEPTTHESLTGSLQHH